MSLSDWTELEALRRKLADLESRLRTARATQNHGLVEALEREIAAAEGSCDRMISQIAAHLAALPHSVFPGDPSGAAARSAPPQPVPKIHLEEGVRIMWNELHRADIERVKRELEIRRSELLARHAAELETLDADKAEIDILEQAIDSLARKFNLGTAEVVPLERPLSQTA